MAADGRGHVYVLYPQYGAVPDCSSCTAPSVALIVSSDNGLTWEPSKALLPFSTGQFDPQIVVDPVDRQTVYASWLQNNKRDIMVARSLDFGHSWSFSWAERGREDADRPVLTVRGADVYVGFNHEEKFFVAASHDAGQTFSAVQVNPNAVPGSSLAGGATVDPAGNVYFGWTAYARHEMASRPVSVYVSRSSDGGRTWSNLLLDVSSAPPELRCAKLRDRISGRADRAGIGRCGRTLRAVECRRCEWRTGARVLLVVDHGRSKLVGADQRVEMPRRASSMPSRRLLRGRRAMFASRGWMRGSARRATPIVRCGTRSTGVRPTAAPPGALRSRLSGPAEGYDYILPGGFRFPFGDYFGLAIDSDGATHAVWGEGRDYKSPGSIWYTRGR